MNDERQAVDFAALQLRIQMRAAKARSAEDWFDIFQEVVFSGLRQSLAQAGVEGTQLADKVLDEQRIFYRNVRDRFRVQGMDLGEGVEWEGPIIAPDQFGFPRIMGWPRGMWARATWGDKSKVEWRGKEAEIAVSFVIWWSCFQQVYQEAATQHSGLIVNESVQRRLVQQDSSEFVDYVKRKAEGL
jgi:hypothetical protein